MEEQMGSDKKEREEDGGGLLQRLLASRTVIVSGGVDAELAQKIVQQLILLDHEAPGKQILVLINSPGGEVFSGFAIFDTIRFISSPVITLVSGLAASMGSIIALAAKKENRLSLPNAKFLIHQPLMTGYQGRATDLEIQANEILRDRERIVELYAEETGRAPEEVAKDIDRDNWMNPDEALSYGLIDRIILRREEIGTAK